MFEMLVKKIMDEIEPYIHEEDKKECKREIQKVIKKWIWFYDTS